MRRLLAPLACSTILMLVPTNGRAAGVVGDGTPESCTASAFAAALAGGGLVTFDCGAEKTWIFVDTALIESGNTTTVDGGGRIELDGQLLRRIFHVLAGGELTLRDIALVNGNAEAGGAIRNDGTTRIERVEFGDNAGVGLGGGAIYSIGTLEVTDSHFAGNLAGFADQVPVSESATHTAGVASAAPATGGAILVGGGSANVERCLFAWNEAEGGGGAMSLNASSVGVRNSTFFGQSAPNGAAIAVDDAGAIELVNSTFDGNYTLDGGAGAIFLFAGGGGSTRNTVFAESFDPSSGTAAPHCGGPGGSLLSHGGNLSSDASCQLQGPGDQSSIDPRLHFLRDNGGPTQTIAPEPGSPLIDGGVAEGCPDLDQRGFPRPLDGDDPDEVAQCDIGAVEGRVPEPAAPAFAALVTLAGAAYGRGAARRIEPSASASVSG